VSVVSLPGGWSIARLGDILPLSYGKALVEDKRDSNGNIPVYGSSGVVGVHNQVLVDRPAIIVGRKGNVGAVYFSAESSWVIDTHGLAFSAVVSAQRHRRLHVGIKDPALYDLRCTCARQCHLAGGELELIQFLLGHASVQTTLWLGKNTPVRRLSSQECRAQAKGHVPQNVRFTPRQFKAFDSPVDDHNERTLVRIATFEVIVMAESGLSVSDDEGRMIVKIEGSARVEMAVLLKQKLEETQIAQEVAIDWEGAEHVDACVLQVLLALRQTLAERGVSLMVVKDNAKVRGYLKLSGLSEFFPVRDPASPAVPSEGSDA